MSTHAPGSSSRSGPSPSARRASPTSLDPRDARRARATLGRAGGARRRTPARRRRVVGRRRARWARHLHLTVIPTIPGTLDGAAAAGRDHLRAAGCTPGRDRPRRPPAAHATSSDWRATVREPSWSTGAVSPRRRHAGAVGPDRRRVPVRVRTGVVPPSRRRGPPARPGAARACATATSRSTSTSPTIWSTSPLDLEATPSAVTATELPAPCTASWRSAPIPTTSSSGAAPRWRPGRAPVRTSSCSCSPTARRAPWDPASDIAALVATRQQRAARAPPRRSAPTPCTSSARSTASSRPTRHRVDAVCELVRAVRPDVVLGHDPWKQYRLHPDHRRAGELVIDGIVAARDPHFFPDAGTPHRPARSSCSRPRWSTTSNRSTTTRSPPRSPRSCATAASGARPWASTSSGADGARHNAPRSTTGCATRSTRPVASAFKLIDRSLDPDRRADTAKGPRRAPSIGDACLS